jgi:predicted DNA-binding protein with PD1-like motif
MTTFPSEARFYAFRLGPKKDLRKSIIEFAEENNIKAGSIVTCVGSLEQFHIRFANQGESEVRIGHFEIVSLTGTFSNTSCHLHISVADQTGQTVGGHLLNENFIYTTAELVVADLLGLEFTRETDATYGYAELVIHSKELKKQ